MNSVIIVQARTSSRRLPGKVLRQVNQKPMIVYMLDRLLKSKKTNKVVMATSTDKSDDVLAEIVSGEGHEVYRGSLNDVLDRYAKCAKQYKADVVIRVTGDCPFMDPKLIDEIMDIYTKSSYDYLSNAAVESQLSVPDGYDIEVFNAKTLERAAHEARLASEREHVTPWMRKSQSGIRWKHIKHHPERKFFRLTVDDEKDLEVIRKIIDKLEGDKNQHHIDDVIKVLKINPEIAKINEATIRNEGYIRSVEQEQNISKGQELWEKAKGVIPGGNMLLSKRPEMYLPGKWPTYFSRTKGCYIWDLQEMKYMDMSIMGIGTNILGYSNEEVDEAVLETVHKGNMSTLNCPEEVLLAEKLVSINPWADMVRFARSGGEANAIAIRIARAASGKDKVAICGYHGWHDWYLSTNLSSTKNLEGHLLPGLEPKGVPKELKDTVVPFKYNNIEEFKRVIEENDIGVVKMEVERSEPPVENYLQEIRRLCSKEGIILIYDECTSGFRETFGGLHKKYGVEPDMAMYGKALGNGYAITAVVGKEEIMQEAQNTFISSTFWTERIGPSAALKTLEIMEREESWKTITKNGNLMKDFWSKEAKNNGLKLSTNGLSALAGFNFEGEENMIYKTYITQELLKKGILASNVHYACVEHKEHEYRKYMEEMKKIFKKLGQINDSNEKFEILENEVCHKGFKRLN